MVGFVLQGKRRNDRIYIPDLDVLITEDNTRLVPLLRLLRLMMATGQMSGNIITFKVEAGAEAEIDSLRKTLRVDGKEVPVEVRVGTSDVTGMGEIYVSEDILKLGFGFDFTWSEENYAYRADTREELRTFKLNRPQSTGLLSTKVEQIPDILSETEPPAYPEGSRRTLSFVQAEMRADTRSRVIDRESRFDAYLRPGLNFWGQVANGNYRLRLNQIIEYPDTRIPRPYSWIDEGMWTSKHENYLVRVGDTNIGFSDLVAPGVNLFGASIKWLSQPAGKNGQADQFFSSRKYAFLSEGIFDGYAPLGATVELWVNSRLIDSRLVEEPYSATPGYGYYRFEGVGLLDKNVNEIRTVVKRPDGVVEEFYQQVLGTSLLLPAGQWASLAGVGTRRHRTVDDVETEGFFSGFQLYHGLSDRLTLGLTAAAQEDFAVSTDYSGSGQRTPREYHAGQQAAYNLFDRFLIKEEFGIGYRPADETSAEAYKLGLEYYHKIFRMDSQFFSYAPGYSTGTIGISDRRGYYLSGNLKLFKNWVAASTFLHIRNNLDGQLDATSAEDLYSAALSIPGIVPRSTVRMRTYHSERTSEPRRMSQPAVSVAYDKYTAELESQLTREIDIQGRYTFGKRRDVSPTDDLKYGLPIPTIADLYFYGTRLRGGYAISSLDAVSLTYWDSDLQEQVEFAHNHKYYDSEGRHIWNSRLELGRVLTTSTHYARGYLEFNLDQAGYNRWGLKAGFDEWAREYYFGIYASLSSLFSCRDDGITRVARTGISPDQGGIAGTVYLDMNCNGHRDAEEPAVPDIEVLVDGRQAAESDKNGAFYIPRDKKKECVVLSLNIVSLPATYGPSQGMQRVYWEEAVFTKANLGVSVLNSVSGTVLADLPDGTFKVLAGARVILSGGEPKTVVKDSVTAQDGSFYLGEIKPGHYSLDVDMASVPGVYAPRYPPQTIHISPGKEPTEIEHCDIHLFIKKRPSDSSASAGAH